MIRRAFLALLVTGGLFLAAGCAPATGSTVGGPAASGAVATPLPTATTAVATTLVQVNGALRNRGLTAVGRAASVRLGEPASFAGIPRWPYSVPLAGETDGARFVIYDFGDLDLALASARELATYIVTGPGRVQYLPDTKFALRQVGSTVIFFAWSPENAKDTDGAAAVAAAIDTVGTEIPIQR